MAAAAALHLPPTALFSSSSTPQTLSPGTAAQHAYAVANSRQSSPRHDSLARRQDMDLEPQDARTPTKSDFGGVPGQRPLDETPFSAVVAATKTEETTSPATLQEDSSPSSDVRRVNDDDDDDVEMADDNDDKNVSDDDDDTTDPQGPKKKKRGQRFYCTDFPPCDLSFTRSEHLLRHIRKHTGERPFTCHCGRTFSRLDNLRQHAQTVHVNEEIPNDSLAATGTRFQRQVRTDRVRPPGGRARAGTGGSYSGHSRGHSRNLSNSSVASTTSNISILPDDGRRRPPSLAMAQDSQQPRHAIDVHGAHVSYQQQYGYYVQTTPSGYSTPTSTTYSAANSPRFPVQSPTSIPRAAYYAPPPFVRRLSVPMVSQVGAPTYGSAYYTSIPPPATHHAPNMSTSSIVSPTSPTYSHSRRESESEAELERRRRTWHPDTYASRMHTQANRPATSGLMHQQTIDDDPATAQYQGQGLRLPGIESFDRTASSSVQAGRVAMDEATPRAAAFAGTQGPRPMIANHRATQSAWETGLYQSIDRLGIGNTTPSEAPAVPQRKRPALPAFSFPQAPPLIEPVAGSKRSFSRTQDVEQRPTHHLHASNLHRSQPITIAGRVSPGESISTGGVPTPSTSQGRELYPTIVRPSEHPEKRHSGLYAPAEPQDYDRNLKTEQRPVVRSDSGSHIYQSHGNHHYDPRTPHDSRPVPPAASNNNMDRLAALVAVATSEDAHRQASQEQQRDRPKH